MGKNHAYFYSLVSLKYKRDIKNIKNIDIKQKRDRDRVRVRVIGCYLAKINKTQKNL